MKMIIAMALASVGTFTSQNTMTPVEKLGKEVVIALQKNSVAEYAGLFPSLAEFHAAMDKQTSLYGDFITEAKQEFAETYSSQIIPELTEAFKRTLSEGKAKGIDWSNVQFVRTENGAMNKTQREGTLTVVFLSQGKEHRLQLQKVFTLNDRLQIGTDLRLL